MRIATTIVPILLSLPAAVCGQEQTTSDTGHFEDWLSGPEWGADKQSFEVAFGVQQRAATLTVAESGFGWRFALTDTEQFSTWQDVVAWCTAPGAVLVRTRQNRRPLAGFYDLSAEDLATVVDDYFRKHAFEVEWHAAGWECTSGGLNRPHPADISRILELLEADSSRDR